MTEFIACILAGMLGGVIGSLIVIRITFKTLEDMEPEIEEWIRKTSRHD